MVVKLSSHINIIVYQCFLSGQHGNMIKFLVGHVESVNISGMCRSVNVSRSVNMSRSVNVYQIVNGSEV